MSETANSAIGTEPQGLLDAMLTMIRRKGCDAASVTGYRERSYNIGYCETCSEMSTDVRIYYRTTSGEDRHYEVPYTDLGELIRDLTADVDERNQWVAAATRESDDERWDRFGVHSFDEEPEA